MSRLSLFLLAVICASALNARSVRGIVLSSADSTAVAGASCRLIADGKAVAGEITDENGVFSIDSDLKSTLTLDISMTGYAPTGIIIAGSNKSVDLGTIYIDEAIEALGEVTVTATSFVNSAGRTIVYPSSSEVRASSTSMSLFQKLPLAGLEADPINRTLNVDGGLPYILINGVPSTIEDVNALQPKDIEKIEYSRFTPARYADKGNKGFLNITLKQRNDGGQVYVWARSAVQTAFVDGSVRASYHQGPSQFTLSYNPSWRNYQDVYDYESESFIGDDFSTHLETSDRNPFNYQYQTTRLKYDFSPNTNTLFSATFSASPNSNNRRTLGHTSDSYLGEYDFENVARSNNFSPSLDLFVRHNFNDNNSLEAQVVGTLSKDKYRRDHTYIYDDDVTDVYLMNADSRRRSLISEISYIHDFSQRTQLSAGFQNTVSHSTNKYLNTDYEPVLTENNNYVYATLGQSVGKIYLSLSTGAKMFWIKNDLNRRNFIRNLSTVFGSWNISTAWNLQLAFQYSPLIPSLSSLTDYPQQDTPYLITNGNPNLKVSDRFLFQFMPSYQYKKFNTSLLVNHGFVNKAMISDVRYLGDELFLSQTVNATRTQETMASLNMRIKDIAGFGANVTFRYHHYRTILPEWSKVFNSFGATFSLWWNHGPYTISYWYKIPAKSLNGTAVYKEENGNSLSFDYAPDKHWNLGLSWMYMFDNKGTRYPWWNYSAVNPSTNDRYIKNNSNMVTISVSYNADFGSIFRTARRTLNNSDSGSSLLKM
ncbi:MAG: hypothetical protein K2M19_02375 [Muribaculaceae bacterium]|nr:hypothetical protein [Muribaculaceae bacterium]